MKQHPVRRWSLMLILAALAAIALTWSGTAAQVVTTIAALSRLRPGTISTALALSALSALLSGALWWRLILRLGHSIPFRAALAAYLHAGLAGYVVNIAGPALGSAMSFRRHGVGPRRAVLLTLIANALGFCGILVWAPVGLVLLSRAGMDSALPILGRFGPVALDGSIAVLVLVMLLVLRVLVSAAGSENRVMRRLLGHERTAEEGALPALRYGHLLTLVPYSALSWVMGALALYVVLAAMGPGTSLPLGSVVGAAVVAAALGSLAFFAPEGVGVKEGVLVALLTHATGLPLTTGVAAALAVRALDPLTKLGLLGMLAVTANGAPARVVTNVVSRLTQPAASARQQRGRVVLVAAGMLALGSVLSGYGTLARADYDVASSRDQTPPALVQTVSSYAHPLSVGTVFLVRGAS